jgi:hypothetical protein
VRCFTTAAIQLFIFASASLPHRNVSAIPVLNIQKLKEEKEKRVKEKNGDQNVEKTKKEGYVKN